MSRSWDILTRRRKINRIRGWKCPKGPRRDSHIPRSPGRRPASKSRGSHGGIADIRNWTNLLPCSPAYANGGRFNIIWVAQGCPNFEAFMQISTKDEAAFLNAPSPPRPACALRSSSAPSIYRFFLMRRGLPELMRLPRSRSTMESFGGNKLTDHPSYN